MHAGLLLMGCVLAGCGEKVAPPPKEDLVPVSGTVKLGGKPMEGVLVAFIPAGNTPGQGATAVTDEDGHYELIHSASKEPGASAGQYTVQLSKWVTADGSPLPPDKPPHMAGGKNLIPDRWADKMGGAGGGQANQFSVPAGGATLDFDIPE